MSLPGEGAVDGWAGDGEELCQIADRVRAAVVHPTQLFLLFGRELGWLAPQLAFGAGNGHPFSGAHPDGCDRAIPKILTDRNTRI